MPIAFLHETSQAADELSSDDLLLLDRMIDALVEDIESCWNSSIGCCDACFDEYSAKWPLAYTSDRGIQCQSTPADVFYDGSRHLEITVTKNQFKRLLPYVSCPNCGKSLGPNLFAFELPFDADKYTDDLQRVSDLASRALLARLPLLKYGNARGSHIYLRPSGEHRFTVLDDLNEDALARLSADGFEPCAVVETSSGNFQAWLKQTAVLPKLLGTFAAQTLAARYGADPSAADWRRFGRLPGFTNCKPKYRRDDGLFPFVRLRSHSGQQFSKAQAFFEEITGLYETREREREQRRAARALSPQRGPRFEPSLERFRTSPKYRDRPAAADIAFCVAALASGMPESRIESALEGDYLSRDPSSAKRSAYIRRTISKARDWAAR